MGKRFRLPNGYGSVYKLSGKRRKPYAVAITTGWTDKGGQIQKIIAYVEDRKQGLEILAEYNKNPYDVSLNDLTFKMVWEQALEKKLINLVENNKMSAGNLKCIRSAYINQCKCLHNVKIKDIKTKELQNIIDSCGKGHTTKGYIKNLCNKIFDCAIIDYEAPLAKNPAEKLKIGEKEKSDLHKVFTEKEIDILWKEESEYIAKLILIYLYTGLRPSELLLIKTENIFLEDNYMIGGIKTEAGKNRIIPIHNKIKHIIENLYNSKNEYLVTIAGAPINYDKYKSLFSKMMKELNLDHKPHDTRHTFTSKMKNAGANEYILKLIIGHSIDDLTEKVYTHRDIQKIINEINIID